MVERPLEMRRITDGVFWAGAADWDRRLFDALIPLPNGTSYNAYVIKGSDKTALIDSVDPTKTEVLLARLSGVERLDYIVSQHSEQDHSGAIPAVMERYPDAKVVATPKGKELLSMHTSVPGERISTVADGETLELGGKTLEFLHTPWVHWPETMCTYLREDRILFSCDLFGAHLATDELEERDENLVALASKRYYAEVMMPFRAIIRKHMARFEKYRIDKIAPSHGPIHPNPAFIVKCHDDWTSDRLSNSVMIAYVSMHGSTAKMAEHLAESLTKEGVGARLFNLAATDIGEYAMALVDSATIVIGTPVVLTGAHPAVVPAVFLTNALKPKLRFASILSSYGWGGKAVEQITSMLSGLKLEMLEQVVVKGRPLDKDLAALDALAVSIAAKHKEVVG